jgi:predicted lipid-binding transport protein (Tim44 family)
VSVDPVIIVLAAVAAFIFWRLRSVLGQRTGFERPPIMPVVQPQPTAKIIDLKPNIRSETPIWKDYADEGSDVANGLDAIAKAQKDFTVPEFLSGAKSAYELISEYFAKGDKKNLKPLLTNTVMESFAAVIDEHKSKGETKIFKFVGVKLAKIIAARLNGNSAAIEILFDSEMITATLDKSGATIAGDATAIITNSETWTFERDVTSRDPNWKLAATSDAPE